MNPTCSRGLSLFRIVATSILVGALAGCWRVTPPRAVTTYHYDNLRSGWNSQEGKLNYANVSSLSVKVVQLDDVSDQVDTQPLIVPNLQIAGGTHDVVYVATEGNNVYAFDASTGERLKMVNLGKPVPMPNGCVNNGPTVGIDGTPVIDFPSSTMYVITYNLELGNPVYRIHALDLATLSDKIQPPPLITATQKLANGDPFPFNAKWQRQRPGLLLASGNVYAAFGSFCDSVSDQSRGWVLGWRTGSLNPLTANLLTDSLPSEPNGMFLSTVWMSGWAIAGDQNGNIYFSTGNSDFSGTTYSQENNTSNSVLRLNADLTRPSSTSKFLFTPSNIGAMDAQDLDMSAGGVMLVPPQTPRATLDIAVATGKDGRMFLLNRDNLGGMTTTDTGVLSVVNIGNRCWCGPTYFNDGSPHIVSSGGTSVSWTSGANPGISQNSLGLWSLQTSPKPMLTQTASACMPDTIQDPGFFTSVSSNRKKNAIIWAVSRPLIMSQAPNIWLYAFKAKPSGKTLPLLYESIAGSWPYLLGNANIMPVVANGKVYVASYKELDIFGLNLPSAQGAQKVQAREALTQVARPELVKGPEEHQVSGIVRKVDDNHLTIETRDNKAVEVDVTEAKRSSRYSLIVVGNSVVVAGSYDANEVLRAVYVWRAKPAQAAWPPDR